MSASNRANGVRDGEQKRIKEIIGMIHRNSRGSKIACSERGSVKSSEEAVERMKWVDEDELSSDADADHDTISSERDDGVGAATRGDYIRARRNQKQPVWSRTEIMASLRCEPGGEEIAGMLEAGDLDRVVDHPKAASVGLLLAAYMDNVQLLHRLIGLRLVLDNVDNMGRTALHLACCAGAAACCRLLLQHGAKVDKWDAQHRATPLHCAAGAASLPCLRLMLQAGADVNAGLGDKSSPLHYAVQSDAVACVAELLTSGAIPNTPQVFTETPLHVAAALGSASCVRLLLQHGAGVRVQSGRSKVTPLHLAAEDGNAECAGLLLDAGADPDAANARNQTPLHMAALSQCGEVLELLINRGADPNREDSSGRTPLHGAIVKGSRSCDCVRLLIDAGCAVNRPDTFGYTPLHIAALNEFSACVYLLLSRGGDVTAKTKGGASALSFIVRRTPDILPRFVANLDAAVKLHDHEIGDVDCELKLDFRILVPSVERGETELLLAFIDVGQRQILKHPLCETFLFLKWRRIRKFFVFSLIFHMLFVLLLSTYVIGVYLDICPPKVNGTQAQSNVINSSTQMGNFSMPVKDAEKTITMLTYIAGILLLVLNSILMLKEVFQLCHSWSSYLRTWENWLQWVIIMSTFVCAFPHDLHAPHCSFANPLHHVAAICIFFAWLELMMLVGRFPMFGLYVQMFTTVAVNFAKFLLAYSCLLIAFGLSFAVLFSNYKSFNSDWVLPSLMKTVIMMSGELEFEDIFYNSEADPPIQFLVTTHLMFLAFVLLVTVILTNLLVGLAVSDIQGLQQSAGLDRLVRQAELVARLESIFFSKLLICLPKKILAICKRSALLLTSSYQWALYLRPNDPRENRVPRDLIVNIFRLVAERKEKPRNRASSRVMLRLNTSRHFGDYRMSTGEGCGAGMRQTEAGQKLSAMLAQMTVLMVEMQDREAASQAKLEHLASQMCRLQYEFQQGNYIA